LAGQSLWLYDELTDTQTEAEAVNAAHIVARALREPDFDDGLGFAA